MEQITVRATDHQQDIPERLEFTQLTFPASEYLEAYPDVADAVEQGLFASAFEHWVLHGRKEIAEGLRVPFDMVEPAWDNSAALDRRVYEGFDEFGYRDSYPDLSQCGDGLEHWLNHGRFEGRVAPGIRPYITRSRDLSGLESAPFGVNFLGPLKATSGLGTAARGYVEAVQSAGIPLVAADLDVSLYRPGADRSIARLPRGYKRHRVNIIQQNCDMISHMCRVYGSQILDDRFNIGIWAWELATFRPDWMPEFGALDEVWALTDFCRDAIATIAPVPVRTMQCVVQPGQPDPAYGRAYFHLPEDAFIFCFVFDVSSVMARKNPLALVEAFKQTFGDDPKVQLLLKYHTGGADRTQVGRLYAAAQAPNIRLMADKLSDAEMLGLKASCDCLVSPHRCEGFGLNIAEMMYLGKPVIATGYSGNMDFTTPDNSYLIDYQLRELEMNAGPYVKGSLWAEPSIDHLGSLMRRVYENPEEASAKGQRAAADIRAGFSAEAVGRRIASRLRELGLDEDLPPFVRAWGRSTTATWRKPISEVRDRPCAERILNLELKPLISIVVPVYNVPPQYLRKCIESVRSQHYPNWELCLCDDASTSAATVKVLDEYQGLDPRIKIRRLDRNRGISGASNAAAEIATGEFIALLDNDDEIHPMALLRAVEEINRHPTVDYIYTDEDKINEKGEHVDHYCKPDWSPEHLESVMYLLHLQIFRKSLFLKVGGFREEFTGAQDYDLALRMTRETSEIVHIPEILYHWRMISGSAAASIDAKPKALANAFDALADHVKIRYGGTAWVENGGVRGFYRVRHRIVGTPPVTLMIPTDNQSTELVGRGTVNMVDNLIRSIQEKTSYPNYRILIVDNGNLTAAQASRYRKAGIRIASYPGPRSPFNFSRKANFGFSRIDTELFVMLNDDIPVEIEMVLEVE